LRQALLEAARALEAHGLNHGHAGNVSVRYGDGMLITPSGIPADAQAESDMVAMALDSDRPPGQRKPSSEWRFHAAVYQARGDLGAVVHAHPPHATALACTRRGIPAFHYTVALSGAAGIPCADYATFGSQELATAVVRALGRSRRACLMANHGMLTAAPDLDTALMLAREVEYLAQVYALSLQVGPPVVLDEEEMARVLQRIQGYGQQI
jgi:L-fuculose-phosphate aldolase